MRARLIPYPSEEDEQAAVITWARAMRGRWPCLDLLYAIPNGARTSWRVAKRLKSTGLNAGVPDLCLPVARGGYHGCYLEMKREKGGYVSSHQKAWMSRLAEEGYFVRVCKGADEALHWLTRYLTGDAS